MAAAGRAGRRQPVPAAFSGEGRRPTGSAGSAGLEGSPPGIEEAERDPALLWTEYREAYPDGYGYSQYCDLYRRYALKLDPPMRQNHKAGEKLFVDYAGDTIPITDPETGEVSQAQIFVACWVPAVTPMPKHRAARRCRTGSAGMCVPLRFSGVCRRSSCRTI